MSKFVALSILLSLVGLIALFSFALLARPRTAVDSNPKKAKRTFLGMPVAESITINDLPDQLTRLVNGQTEFEFIGIHSNGTDCIYLMYENNTFNIDYEAMSEDQLPFIKRLKDYAETKQIRTAMTTYGNDPHYDAAGTAPVLQLKMNADLKSVVEIARDIEANVFNNTNDTLYEVVP
jgi:hypothetical protein